MKYKRSKPMLLRSKTKTKSDRLREGKQPENENNFYAGMMEDMKVAGHTKIDDFVKELKAKEEGKDQLGLTDK